MSRQRGWRWVTSPKAQRAGEVFIMFDDQFVMKIYADATGNNEAFAHWLVGQFNRTGKTPEQITVDTEQKT